MPEILSYAAPAKPLRGRPLAQWIWLIAYLAFPVGPFLALAGAQLISWRKAIVLAIVSLVSSEAVVALMMWLETLDDSFFKRLMVAFPVMVIMAWSIVMYRIGRVAEYWSARTRRSCLFLFWMVLSLIFLNILVAFLVILRPVLF